jgi:actin-related protein
MDQIFDYGKIKNYESAGEYIDFLARKLNTDLRDVPLLLTTQNNYHQEDLKNLAKLTFESKNTPALFFVRKGVSVLFANGKTNGINLESGHNQTHIIPVHDGYSLQNHCKSIRIGGKIVNQYILDLIKKQKKGQNLTAPFELFPGDSSLSSEFKKLKYVSRNSTASYRKYAENKVIRDLKPVLNKLRQIKQGE